MLNEKERDYVIGKVLDEIQLREKPRESLVAPFINTPLPQQLPQGAPAEMTRQVMTFCLRDEWNNEPPLLLRLLAIPTIVDSKLDEIRSRIRVRPTAAPDPLLATILSTGMPFVNRSGLRAELRDLAQPAASLRPILVVKGASRSGKSYSTEYIDHFSVRQGFTSITAYRLSMIPEEAPRMDCVRVARSLVEMMGRSVADIPSANSIDDNTAPALASWVLNNALQVEGKHWFVLDSFSGKWLRPDTRKFIISLCENITNGRYKESCRVILIDFDSAGLTVSPGRIRSEKINGLHDNDIATCLTEILAMAPRPIAVADIMPFLTTGLPTDAERIVTLNRRLRAVMLAVKGVASVIAVAPEMDFSVLLLKMLEDLPAGEECLAELELRLDSLYQSAQGE
jgi:hypothetical protein